MALGQKCVICVVATLLGGAFARPQTAEAPINGLWKITKILPTHNPACWDAETARTLIGTTLRYAPNAMNWKGGQVAISETLSRTLSRRKYQDEYKVDLAELGIHADAVTEIDLQHEDADITGATTEVPGDTIVVASVSRIIVSACGVFYEATRVSDGKGASGRTATR